ncbi:MAG: type II toxin-antitoxin system HicB family antitoxin [Chloroflexota bacterium]
MPVQNSKIEGLGYRAECTILPGCFVDGATLEEVLADIQEAIVLYIGASRERGLPLPEMVPAPGSAVLTIVPVAVPS